MSSKKNFLSSFVIKLENLTDLTLARTLKVCSKQKDDLVNELLRNKGVFRTATATAGLINTPRHHEDAIY